MFSDEEIDACYEGELVPGHVSEFHRVFNQSFPNRETNDFTIIERKGTPPGLASPLVAEEKKHEIRSLGGRAVHALAKGQSGLTADVRARARAKSNETNRRKGRRRRLLMATNRVVTLEAKLKLALQALELARTADAVDRDVEISSG